MAIDAFASNPFGQQGEEVPDSFAAIAVEPPAEVAATGHDRCIITIKGKNSERLTYALIDTANFETTPRGCLPPNCD